MRLLIIVIATFFAYSNIFQNDFVIDDTSFIEAWPTIQSLGNIPQLLAGDIPPSHGGVYRPIRSVLYALYYSLFGTNPFGWHLHSLVVHLLSTVFVYLIVEQLFKRNLNQELGIRNQGKSHNSLFLIHNSIPFVSSLLFGLHPIHTESIAYISASMDTTGILFLFASFYFYLHSCHPEFISGSQKRCRNPSASLASLCGRSGLRAGKFGMTLSILFALLAFFTNEMTLTLPVLILLHNVILRESREAWRPKNLTLQATWPYFVTAAFYVFVRFVLIGIGASRGDYLANSFYHTMITMPKIFVWYISLLFVPLKLSAVHTIEEGFETYMIGYSKFSSILSNSIFDLDILLSILVLLALIVGGFLIRKKYPLVALSIGWFFISLTPVSYVVPVGPALSERYLYIPSFGFVLLFSYVILSTFDKLSAKDLGDSSQVRLDQNDKTIVYAALSVCFVIAVLYAYRTYTRNLDWRNSETLWSSVIREYPKSLIGHYNLSGYYSSVNNLERAAEEYRTIIALEPKFWEARFNMANTYGREGKVDEAIDEYKLVLATTPNFLDAYINLALAYDARGETDQAIATLTKGLAIDSKEYRVFNNQKSPQEVAIGFEKTRSLLERLKNAKR